jgi:hypothetical protein
MWGGATERGADGEYSVTDGRQQIDGDKGARVGWRWGGQGLKCMCTLSALIVQCANYVKG